MKTLLRYPAVFYPDENSVSVFFPDLKGCLTYGNNLDHAYAMATECLSVWMEVQLEKGLAPQASSLDTVMTNLRKGLYDDEITTHTETSFVMAVEVDPKILKDTRKKAVKVNTSMPLWMKTAADDRGINISKVLQEALVREFDKTDYSNRMNK